MNAVRDPGTGENGPAVHCSPDALIRFLREELPEEEELSIAEHLGLCGVCAAALQEEIRCQEPNHSVNRAVLNGKERRKEARIKTEEKAIMWVLSPFSTERLPVMILDLSANGSKLRVPQPVPVGAMVQVRLARTILMGEVRYCRATEDGFHIGMRTEDCTPY